MPEQIRVEGLRELRSALKRMDTGLPKLLRVALNEASGEVVDYAQARMPKRSGRAAASLKAKSTQKEARVGMGGRRAPYAPWLDFGGRVGPKRSVNRPFIRDGRYVYKGLENRRPQIIEIMSKALVQLAKDSGMEVS